MNENKTDKPAQIERDIQRTQNDMSRTVDKIGDQLTAKNLFNALLDKADENGVDAHYLIDGARRNPMALGLIAAGAIWLVSDKNAKFPSLSSGKSKGGSDEYDELDLSGQDVHHRDYVAHMSALEIRDGEDDFAYQRRRDVHRATFLMCEREPNEDDQSFRQRLNDMTDKFREKRRAWSDSASETGSQASQRAKQAARRASGKAQDMYESNPLVGGILAAAVGAALGSTIPVSRTEKEKLGDVGAKAREAASEKKDEMTSQLSEKKDELLEKADRKIQEGSKSSDRSSGQREPAMQSDGSSQPGSTQSSGDNQRRTSEGPFIMPERNS